MSTHIVYTVDERKVFGDEHAAIAYASSQDADNTRVRRWTRYEDVTFERTPRAVVEAAEARAKAHARRTTLRAAIDRSKLADLLDDKAYFEAVDAWQVQTSAECDAADETYAKALKDTKRMSAARQVFEHTTKPATAGDDSIFDF